MRKDSILEPFDYKKVKKSLIDTYQLSKDDHSTIGGNTLEPGNDFDEPRKEADEIVKLKEGDYNFYKVKKALNLK